MSLPIPYYDDGQGIVIYHGDGLDILPALAMVDLVLTDPPYGVQMSNGFDGFDGFGGFGPPIARRQYPDAWDKERPSSVLFAMLLARCDKAIIFGGNFFADLLPASTHWIVWDKLNTMPTFGDCELAWTNVDRKSVKKKTVEWNGLLGKERERFHPTQKPLELMAWCLETYSQPTHVILDPFMGSGTTLRAAKDLGRKCIGIEIEEKYCEIAVRRLAQTVLPL
jgi:DNA modification methylase